MGESVLKDVQLLEETGKQKEVGTKEKTSSKELYHQNSINFRSFWSREERLGEFIESKIHV